METTLALKHVANIPVVHVAMDTSIEKVIFVRLGNGKTYSFKQCV